MPIVASVNDLCRIAANGGGMDLRGKTISVDDLCRIAANASTHGARLIISPAAKSVDDLCRIAANGKGCVSFQD